MLYKQAQEGIAKEIRTPLWFLNCAFPKIFNSSLDIADYSDKSLEISKILAVIFTPEEIEEWKKGEAEPEMRKVRRVKGGEG